MRRSRKTETGDRPQWVETAQTAATLATGIATLATGIAAIAALLFTQQSIAATQDELAITRDQLAVTERGQVSDRFGRAVEQLGAKTLDVRLGGIYALEQLMRDSSDDQPTIIEVLSAYIRTRTLLTDTPAKHRPRKRPGVRLATDVQAALTVLGRRNPHHDVNTLIDLAEVDLAGANLTGVKLALADLGDANLALANLRDVDLEGANLSEVDLRGAVLDGANLSDANLTCIQVDADTPLPAGVDIPPPPLDGCPG